jgi:hypothetical protein
MKNTIETDNIEISLVSPAGLLIPEKPLGPAIYSAATLHKMAILIEMNIKKSPLSLLVLTESKKAITEEIKGAIKKVRYIKLAEK